MANRKQKHTRKLSEKSHKAQAVRNQFDTSMLEFSGKSFRLLAFQALSLSFDFSSPFELFIQNLKCRFAFRPAHSNRATQLTQGGTFVVIEFSTEKVSELFTATRIGLDLIDDFFSALSLVEGATFRDVKPVQIMIVDQIVQGEFVFINFLNLSMNHWHKTISKEDFQHIQSILAHWDGLDNGKRLRRAARQFQKAIGSDDGLLSFQHAYMGLEAIEKPLADTMNISPGVEEIDGCCEKCGEKYTRKRTVLAGVRAYVSGATHPDDFDPERKREWKKINDFRHKIFHSLQDNKQLELKVHEVLPAAMHYLHDAICCLSHSHDLESSTFKLPAEMRPLVFIGKFNSSKLEPLEECQALLKFEAGYWVPHPQHGFVPRFEMQNPGHDNLSGYFFWLDKPLRSATKENLVPAIFEDNSQANKANSADAKSRAAD